MSTWEQRMAQRRHVRGGQQRHDGNEYQRARLYAMIRAANHARGPQPHGLAPCCWRDKWLGDVWGVEAICQRSSSLAFLGDRPICAHEHHDTEGPWMANAA